MRKIQRRESELIKSVSVALRFIRSSRGLGKMRRVYTGALLANLKKMKGRTLFMRNLEKEQRLGRNGIENLCINIGCFEMNNKIWSADRILWLNSNIGCFEML